MMNPAVKSIWTEYLPYLHLGNRRDIQKPDIALFSSSQDARLLERSTNMCYDLGRGDLQLPSLRAAAERSTRIISLA